MPNPNPRIPEVRELFSQSQDSKRNHAALINKMNELHQAMDVEEFAEAFTRALSIPLSIGETNPKVNNILSFACMFSVRLHSASGDEEDEEMNPFLKKLFEFLLSNSDTADPSLRYRIAHFLNMLLSSMGGEASIDDDVYDDITSRMVKRMLDPVPRIRSQAILALSRLQDPSNEDCPIIKAYIYHMKCDPQPRVRQAAVANVGKNKEALLAGLTRTRDVSNAVRRQAFRFVSQFTVRSLTIKMRLKVLGDGLRDRSKEVRDIVERDLLPGWLDQCDGDFVKLLSALDAEVAVETCDLALRALFKTTKLRTIAEQVPIDEDTKLIPVDKLTAENAVYWRCVVEHLQREKLTDDVESLLPDLTYFCQYVRAFLERVEQGSWEPWEEDVHAIVLSQLFKLAETYDLGDEVGRQELRDLVLDTLKRQGESKGLVFNIVTMLTKVVEDHDDRFHMLAAVINELRTPCLEKEKRDRAAKKSKIRDRLDKADDEQDQAVAERNFARAHELSEEIKALNAQLKQLSKDPPQVKNDVWTLTRCLEILYAMMQGVEKSHEVFKNLYEDIVQPSLSHDNDQVMELAIQCATNYSMKNREAAKRCMPMFLLHFAYENEAVWLVTLKGIFDLLLTFGLQTFDMAPEAEDDSDASNKNFINVLTGLLDKADQDLRTIATEGLCKLVLNRKIASSSLITKLLILWNNPVTLEDCHLRQTLTHFFNNYPTVVEDGRRTLRVSLFQTLRILANAPEDSPLRDIKPAKVIELVSYFVRPKPDDDPLEYSAHDRLASDMIEEMLKADSEIEPRHLITGLKFLVIDTKKESLVKTLRENVKKVLDKIHPTEKLAIKSVAAFQKRLYPEQRAARVDGESDPDEGNVSDLEAEGEAEAEAEIEDDFSDD